MKFQFDFKYWQISWKSVKMYCDKKMCDDLWVSTAVHWATYHHPADNADKSLKIYCKILTNLIFWKSFLDFNNVDLVNPVAMGDSQTLVTKSISILLIKQHWGLKQLFLGKNEHNHNKLQNKSNKNEESIKCY